VPVERLDAEWLADGLSTETADFDTTEQLITGLYTRAGRRAPT
jgi:hypothetical protein